MALNSAVTPSIAARSAVREALQALTAGLLAHSDFNPGAAQASHRLARAGDHPRREALRDADALDYPAYLSCSDGRRARIAVTPLRAVQCLLVEGAGSPAEINLRDRDIASMGFCGSRR
ncbi:MAG: hypothetical protein IPL11_19135 [Candidatus Accumulibacter sp.]|nr:hypothetical protein [Accumulibacter sp.]